MIGYIKSVKSSPGIHLQEEDTSDNFFRVMVISRIFDVLTKVDSKKRRLIIKLNTSNFPGPGLKEFLQFPRSPFDKRLSESEYNPS